MKNIIHTIVPYYQNIRQQLHAAPELRYEEINTAALIATELRKIGLTVETGIAKTGVVAILDSGKPGKTVALRAEMDALPLTEMTGLAYQSKIPGKMHACGHDGHMAALLATAKLLSELKPQLVGKIKFIFQPAEEGGAGAKAMIEAGVLENPHVDAIFAFHNHPGYEVGTILTRPGCVLYGNADVTLTIHGKGGHAASPEGQVDPILIGATIIQNFAGALRQINDPVEPIIASITQFHAGTTTNIVPSSAEIIGTIRSSNKEKNIKAQQHIKLLAENSARALGGTVECRFKINYPATINPSSTTTFVLDTARELFGDDNVMIKPLPARASEDFSFYLEKILGCYFFIGSGMDQPQCHNDRFDFNDALLPVAVEMLANLAIRYTQQK